ncbi:hypothetical protein [Glycomyces algeriensis]|uniref:Uncharacterized protein n=1 Tax=Glycomyces algeriensis TaxID=256037 RepID=A0A9W6GBM0_9ACTN|nr:hypothetical protein [Glycomyces algeriensis]MDA1369021.1 hypothetical protein [Glycomyces algeriensis]MDR7352330.1 hypothetical protein [Glycomyces algeriensis]GLI45065.1 hypothetical protein GALLR39Z86_49150 [Glycomyces algeriensis]
MRYWLLALNEDEYTEQQAYEVEAFEPASRPERVADGDEVALAGPEGVFALGEVDGPAIAYRRRLEEPAKTVETVQIHGSAGSAEDEVYGFAEGGAREGWTELNPDAWEDLVRTLPTPERRSDWLVTLSMPIEAVDKAEAVRQFWSYIRSLGPKELPTFVAPYGRELEGTSFLLGVEHEQDPEE